MVLPPMIATITGLVSTLSSGSDLVGVSLTLSGP